MRLRDSHLRNALQKGDKCNISHSILNTLMLVQLMTFNVKSTVLTVVPSAHSVYVPEASEVNSERTFILERMYSEQARHPVRVVDARWVSESGGEPSIPALLDRVTMGIIAAILHA
ncbi:hypothetical protein ALC62_07428 [Cyphomyrmex costatus]|uniref:Uncharacterized protein n=1 Tax=Cyphomyrmex costatus TaxID=456900 RepID=A0A195CM16_9HYME|nr:hypothetical protein ALC62_07428 [Cyphomyrmex costatus]